VLKSEVSLYDLEGKRRKAEEQKEKELDALRL